jgi:two-component system chemotaxis sensor kinase CheA
MTSRRLGKGSELILRGEDTKIDSRIIEEMRDPLMHLVQNAIRHGIELPEDRQKKGKNPTGTVTVSAHQEGNRIVIRVQDDGKGIDVKRIKKIATETGIISQRDIRKISEQDLYEFLFQPGFSTAENVDDIAGRGFGLDIVRDHVDRVQGEIEVHSHPNQGTEFAIKLPLTLTIINALLVRVADEIFAIPTTAIEKTFDISSDDIEHLGNVPIVVVEGSLLPVIELQKILHFSKRHPSYNKDETQPVTPGQNTSHQTVIMIQSEDRRIGFLVDDLIEEREIVIKHLGSCLKRVRNVAGATALREDVIIILFIRDLVRSADALLEEVPAQTMLLQESSRDQSSPNSFTRNVPKILIVDDSMNTREVERTILESAGYQVETAVNGAEGLAKLKQHHFDLVVTDIEMPEMDGWQLTEHIKHDEALHETPVIIISTRGTEKDKQKSLDAGAYAYIVKREFDEQTLLHTVDSCLKE